MNCCLFPLLSILVMLPLDFHIQKHLVVRTIPRPLRPLDLVVLHPATNRRLELRAPIFCGAFSSLECGKWACIRMRTLQADDEEEDGAPGSSLQLPHTSGAALALFKDGCAERKVS